MKRGKNSKKKAQRHHAKVRGLQRYDIYVSNELLDDLIAKIQGGKAKHLDTQSNRVTVWQVTTFDGQDVKVCYDKQRKEIITFLPPEAYEVVV